jgi:hypothetical protein
MIGGNTYFSLFEISNKPAFKDMGANAGGRFFSRHRHGG